MDDPHIDDPYPNPDSTQDALAQQIWGRLADDALKGLRPLGYAVTAYFLRYGYVIGDVAEAADSLQRAPWITGDAVDLKIVLEHLLKRRFLVLLRNPDFLASKASSALRVTSAIALNGRPSLGDTMLNRKIQSARHDARRVAQERANLIRMEGWAGTSQVLTRLRHTLEEIRDNPRLRFEPIVIKILAFHGGTWFGTKGTPGVLQSLLSDFRELDLRFQISIISPKAHPRGLEGANATSHRSASENALVNLATRRDHTRGTFQVRYYGELERDLYFRGIVVVVRGALRQVSGVVWFAGIDRALYGLDTEIDRRSNLARLCKMYADDVFSRGIPIGKAYQKIWFYVTENFYALIGAIIWATTIILELNFRLHGLSHIGTLFFALMFHNAPIVTRIKRIVGTL